MEIVGDYTIIYAPQPFWVRWLRWWGFMKPERPVYVVESVESVASYRVRISACVVGAAIPMKASRYRRRWGSQSEQATAHTELVRILRDHLNRV